MRPADYQARRAAIGERARNVIVDAGPGTGKTTLLVERLLSLLAPEDDGDALTIDRVAAITFTRRAAAEMRLRVRERILAQVSGSGLTDARRGRLLGALGGLDTAFIGTIHSFADRLLRLRPVQAWTSPEYEIVDEDLEQGILDETVSTLIHAAETNTMARWLKGSEWASRADEAERTILDAISAGVLVQTIEFEFYSYHGLSSLFGELVASRDYPPADPEAQPFALATFRRAAEALVERIEQTTAADSAGMRWLRQLGRLVDDARPEDDPVILYRRLVERLEAKPPDSTKKRGFDNDKAAWRLFNDFRTGDPDAGRPALRDRVLAPLREWMARRLVRTAPVVVAVHEAIKTSHQAIDYTDLLLRLRDVLQTDLDTRQYFQGLFDHIFVDEFQDTDPLQGEVVVYLCEQSPAASVWSDVELQPGKLTVVGDPKQSIYRFRRADVAMYDAVRTLIADSGALEVELVANFRSWPAMVEWGNQSFRALLGDSPDGRLFDPDSGTVFHRPLTVGRTGGPPTAVELLDFGFDDIDKPNAEQARQLEAHALAHYLRWLVEVEQRSIIDRGTAEPRPIRYGDIAVLTVSTHTIAPLFPALDDVDVPHAVAGGTVFLRNDLHRRFLLGLRAIADRDDGVAMAALLAPPFFAVGPCDLLALRNGAESGDGVSRARDATEVITELRRQRHARPPGQTARDLLERTCFARYVACLPNGAQRLAGLRELCLLVEQKSIEHTLDFDGVTSLMRQWVDQPVQLDSAPPVDDAAVHVMTVHQAKGLEFPVVYLWDSRASIRARADAGAWRVDRDSGGWELSLRHLSWKEPQDLELRERELQYLHAERRRVAYVAATRARDLLVIPNCPTNRRDYIASTLLTHPDGTVGTERFGSREPPAWSADALATVVEPALPSAGALHDEVRASWDAASANAGEDRLVPLGVSAAAKAEPSKRELRPAGEDDAEIPPNRRKARYGSVFGDAVHLALHLCLRYRIGAEEGARRAILATQLDKYHAQVAEDVGRGLAALRELGLPRAVGPALRSELPVFVPSADGAAMLNGYIDLVGVVDGATMVIDFKTDRPPKGAVEEALPAYCRQVRVYGQALIHAGVCNESNLAGYLLFTADGSVHPVHE